MRLKRRARLSALKLQLELVSGAASGMDVFHLEFDIDGLAHPELHDTLAVLSDPSSRGERIRQLAMTGLIWERLRLQPDGVRESRLQLGAPSTAKRLALVPGAVPTTPNATGLPVLRDVVSDAEMDSHTGSHLPAAAESLPFADDPQHATASTASGAATSEAPVVHMPGTRSRLMRMKSRGLFANE